MKPLTIIVGTLVKIGLGVAAAEVAYAMGKGVALSAARDVNPETADTLMKCVDEMLDSKEYSVLDKLRLKIIKGTYKISNNKT